MNAVRESVDVAVAFAEAADRFARSVATADLRAPVRSCPGWSAYDVVVHVGNVHAWAATIVETRAFARVLDDLPRSTKPRAVSAWYVAKAEDLYAVLRSTPYDEPCWNFAFGEGVVGFWPRRQLHETCIHQVDLDLAAGRGADATAVPPEVAADGVDEVLTVFLHRMATKGHPASLSGRLLLSATDTGDHWLLSPRPRHSSPVPSQPSGPVTAADFAPRVEHRRTVPDDVTARVAAPAAVLHRLLWGREPLEHPEVEVSGEQGVAHDFVKSRLVP